MYPIIQHTPYRRLGGIINAVDPNREIGFGFVSCSCRACVRACEAVWVRERGAPQRWGPERQQTRLRAWFGLWFSLFVFVAIYMGFKFFSHGLLLCSWAFWSFLVFDGMLMGFLMLLHTLFAFAAMLMGFLIFSCFWWYAHGFFDVVAQLSTTCNLHSWAQQVISTADLNRWTQQIISTVDFNRWSQQQISTDNRNKSNLNSWSKQMISTADLNR